MASARGYEAFQGAYRLASGHYETYDLNIYGTLEPGIYRLVVQNLSAEFLVGHGNLSAKRD